MFNRADMIMTMDQFKADVLSGAETTGREIQSATDQMDAAMALWLEEEQAIANTEAGLAERRATNNNTLRAAVNSIVIALTTVRRAMEVAPVPKAPVDNVVSIQAAE